MTAEAASASLVKNLAGSASLPVGYYRSKLFVAPFSSNTLVAAAGPLFSLLERLSRSTTLPDIATIRDNIEHELRAFHSRLHGKTHTTETDTLAHYLLCATIDEILGKNYIRLYGKPAEFTAFTPPSFDNIGPEQRFFDIILYIKDKPNQFLDLIELAYHCLITGFEGMQHSKADGRQVLDNLIEELFQLIQGHRVNKAPVLFKEPKQVEPIKTRSREVIFASLLSLGLVVSGFVLSFLLVEAKAKSIQNGHIIIEKLDD